MLTNENNSQISLPLQVHLLTLCPYSAAFGEDENLFLSMQFDKLLGLNILNGRPAYLALYKQPPTSCQTPGKMLPGGYTKSGKWKPARWTPLKTDKRAGK